MRAFEKPVVARTQLIGSGVRGARKVQRIERLQAAMIERASPPFNFRRKSNEPTGVTKNSEGISRSYRVRVSSDFIL
jgi:hypothetical protein